MYFSLRFLLLIALVACGQTRDTPVDTSSASREAPLSTPGSNVGSATQGDTALTQDLSCSPTELRAGDTLTVHMKTPHPEYLLADHPDGTPFQIVYPSLGEPSRKYSYVPSEEFKTMTTLRIPADIKANAFVVGRSDGVEPLFSQTGKYVLHLGEPEGRTKDCVIHYQAKR